MQTSTPESDLLVKDPYRILLIGPPGGGKTTLALQFPCPGVLNCDKNLRGPTQYLRSGLLPKLTYKHTNILEDDKGKELSIDLAYDRYLLQYDLLEKDPDVLTIVTDSLTYINEFIIRKILLSQNRPVMEARDYQPLKSDFLKLFMGRIRQSKKTTICIVHEKEKYGKPTKDDMMNHPVIGYSPSIDGSLKEVLGAFFTDIWRCLPTLPVGGKTQPFRLQTIPDGLSPDLKSSCGMPATLPASWGEVNKYLKL